LNAAIAPAIMFLPLIPGAIATGLFGAAGAAVTVAGWKIAARRFERERGEDR
jgi:hypothetical protein